jgi:hypothetical protein
MFDRDRRYLLDLGLQFFTEEFVLLHFVAFPVSFEGSQFN